MSNQIALIDGATEINQTLSRLLKDNTKLNALALYDVAVKRPLPNEQPFEPIVSYSFAIRLIRFNIICKLTRVTNKCQ